jgi:hypothetical protein
MTSRTGTRIATGIPTAIEIPTLMEARTGIPILTVTPIAAAMTMTDTVGDDGDAAEGETNFFCLQFI